MSSTEKSGHDLEEDIDFIDVLNDLQNKLAGHALNVHLPQIVIVGSQNAGKCSVLENLVGRVFLPRGKDLVIRRPTIVQMHPSPHEEYAVFSHKPDLRFSDFKAVKEEIESENRKHPGVTGFTSDPIILKIFSPHVLKLTVVDLPELIQNVEDGQAQANVQEVREMILSYIQPQESIILAATSATQDIVTSDALKIAEEVDPKRERTIGVLTELDGVKDRTEARDVLENRKLCLKMGYVGIVNRNQIEIESGKDLLYILQEEKEFFANRPEFKHLKDMMGVPYLIRMLQKTLRRQIKQLLPKLRSDISQKLAYYQQELRTIVARMGGTTGATTKEYCVIRVMQNFIEGIETELMENTWESAETGKFPAGARIRHKLETEVRKNLTLPSITDDGQLDNIFCCVLGVRSKKAAHMLTADAVCRALLQQYKKPMEESISCIKEALENFILQSLQTIKRYPSLENEVRFRILQCIEEEAENTQDRLIAHLDASIFCIKYACLDDDNSVFDPEVSTTEKKVSAKNEVAAAAHEGAFPGRDISNRERELIHIKEDIVSLVMKKLKPLHKQMQCETIKYIEYFLIKKVSDFIKGDLLPNLLESTNLNSIMEDWEDDFRLKEETETICKLLQEALNAIPDI